MVESATQVLRALVRDALRAENGAPRDVDRSSVPWTADVLEAAARHRVVPLLARNAASLPLDDDARQQLSAFAGMERMSLLTLVRQIAQVREVLEAEGIRHLVVKGVALAALETGDFAARGSGDIDLFVSPAQATRATTALLSAGAHLRTGFPSPADAWGWRFLLHNYYEITLESRLGTIDLHWWLHPARRLLPDFETAWAERVQVDVAGDAIPTLHPAHARDLALAGAAKDGWETLRPLADVHRLLRLAPLEAAPARGAAATLAVTRVAIGLPAQAPAVERAIARVPAAAVRRALRAQGSPEFHAGERPGQALVESARRWGHGIRSPRDAARVARFTALPGFVLGARYARPAPRSLGQALAARVAYIRDRSRGAAPLGGPERVPHE